MAKKTLKKVQSPKLASAKAATFRASEQAAGSTVGDDADTSWSCRFSRLACETAHYAGKPQTFLGAVFLVMVWALTGPLFGFSDTWQLVINTSTTIVTFLMVFLLQHTQNRDTLAIQLKLAELITAVNGAKNSMATAEDLSEDALEKLHEEYRSRADQALRDLNSRRGSGQLDRAS